MNKLFEIETIFCIDDDVFTRRYKLEASNLNKALKMAQGHTVVDETKRYKALHKIKSLNYAKDYIKDNIEFVSLNLYEDNFNKFIDEYNPCYY